MNTALEHLDHAPEPESLAEGNFCPLASALRLGFEGMDDMAGFIHIVKAHVQDDFRALGWSDSAAGELAEIHVLSS